MDRGDVVVEFGMDGSKEQRSRTAGHVYVLAPRKRAAAAAAAEAPKKQGIFRREAFAKLRAASP